MDKDKLIDAMLDEGLDDLWPLMDIAIEHDPDITVQRFLDVLNEADDRAQEEITKVQHAAAVGGISNFGLVVTGLAAELEE